MEQVVKKIKEKITYQGKIIEVVGKDVMENGKQKTFEYARRSPGVRLIVPKADKIIISKEFRHELQMYDHRLPGGKVFDTLLEYNSYLESGKDIVEAAKSAAIREAEEEVGIKITDLSFFHKSTCGATIIWDLFYFVVNACEETEKEESDEDITSEFISHEKIKTMCLDGTISEERSALVLLKYLGKK